MTDSQAIRHKPRLLLEPLSAAINPSRQLQNPNSRLAPNGLLNIKPLDSFPLFLSDFIPQHHSCILDYYQLASHRPRVIVIIQAASVSSRCLHGV